MNCRIENLNKPSLEAMQNFYEYLLILYCERYPNKIDELYIDKDEYEKRLK